ncbi:Transmembrane osmosensor [Rhizophlyctis rosea]|nr:Transmembrane osmosensor [Rhizophlyctis rosea]
MTQKNTEATRSKDHVAAKHPAYADAPTTTTGTTTTVPVPPKHNNETVADTEVDGATTKVITMFSYDANPDDPQEMSFQKNEVLEILDNRGQWWTARRTRGDGTVETGLVPRHYVTPV